MLLIHKDIPHMPITELENHSESVWVKVFANKTSHFVASWYRPPDEKMKKMEDFDRLFREMWVHNNCSFVTDFQYETMQNSSCTWICPKCEFFNFSDSFFSEQPNLEDQNRFISLVKEGETTALSTGTKNNKFVSGLKFSSIKRQWYKE